MSFTPSRTVRGNTQRRTDNQTIVSDTEISSLLAALEDDDCRAILEAASDQPRSASELCELCDLSSSTAYRKVDELTDAGLLEESIRLSQSGSHTSQYLLAVSDLTISLGSGIELSMSENNDNCPFATAD